MEVRQESTALAVTSYRALKDCRDFSLKQMQRAAVLIALSIAEGFDRRTQKEFIQYFYVARRSCAEVMTQLYIGQVGVLDEKVAEHWQNQIQRISAMLYNLIQYRRKFT